MSRWIWLSAALAVRAFAQDAAPPATTNPGDASGVSAQEEADIARALAQDAAANAKANGTPAPPDAVSAAPQQAAAAPTGAFSLQSLNPDLSFIADVALAAFDRAEPKLGDLQFQAGGHDPQHNGFNLQQLELSVGKSVDPYLRFDANIVFSQDGVEVEEAYATSLTLPWQLQARVGKFLSRFGRLNATHPHTWDFVDQPFIVSKFFGSEGNRGVGAELSWLTPLPWYAELVGESLQPSEEGATRSFIDPALSPDFHIRSPADLEYVLALKQFFALSDDLSLMWGLSAATGPNGQTSTAHSTILGTDLYLKFRPLTEGSFTIVTLQAEAFYRRRPTATDALTDGGGYAYLFWRFDPRWGTALRYELGTPAVGQRGSLADDYLDPDWSATRHRVSANVTFWPTEFSRLRLQGSVGTLGQDTQWAAFLTLEVAVGAHGAHQF